MKFFALIASAAALRLAPTADDQLAELDVTANGVCTMFPNGKKFANWAFKKFDADGNGHINKAELTSFLSAAMPGANVDELWAKKDSAKGFSAATAKGWLAKTWSSKCKK